MTEAKAIPYICCKDAAGAIEFYKKGFGATESGDMWVDPSGRVGHAEIEVEGARIMLSDEHPEIDVVSPQTLGGTSSAIYLNVADVDAFTERAVAAGARMPRSPEDKDYGDRSATLVDPYGHRWLVATTRRDVTEAEVQKSMEAYRRGDES
jgi:PhnB protein